MPKMKTRKAKKKCFTCVSTQTEDIGSPKNLVPWVLLNRDEVENYFKRRKKTSKNNKSNGSSSNKSILRSPNLTKFLVDYSTFVRPITNKDNANSTISEMDKEIGENRLVHPNIHNASNKLSKPKPLCKKRKQKFSAQNEIIPEESLATKSKISVENVCLNDNLLLNKNHLSVRNRNENVSINNPLTNLDLLEDTIVRHSHISLNNTPVLEFIPEQFEDTSFPLLDINCEINNITEISIHHSDVNFSKSINPSSNTKSSQANQGFLDILPSTSSCDNVTNLIGQSEKQNVDRIIFSYKSTKTVVSTGNITEANKEFLSQTKNGDASGSFNRNKEENGRQKSIKIFANTLHVHNHFYNY